MYQQSTLPHRQVHRPIVRSMPFPFAMPVMTHRYYATQLAPSTVIDLGPEEAKHAQVMRLQPGDQIVLFDGQGLETQASVLSIDRRSLTCQCATPQPVSREAGRPVVLGVALPKGDRQRYLIEKAVELGARQLVPLLTRRGVAEPTAAMKRLPRMVIEASKQCGRNQLMGLGEPQLLASFLASAPSTDERWFAHTAIASPTARGSIEAEWAEPARAWHGRAADAPQRVCWIAIGPEGGWHPEEVDLAAALGWRAVQVGSRTLRTETAALALLTLAVGWTG
jgi:16S rRNA (uracil1498-N3)-methyltransferase